jgi:MerR family transcriptional regulator, light-induced transcriptional regulator
LPDNLSAEIVNFIISNHDFDNSSTVTEDTIPTNVPPFIQALIDNDRIHALSLLNDHLSKNSIESTIENLFLQNLRNIGNLWWMNKITVADEHVASANLLNLAHYMFSTLTPSDKIGKKICVSSVPGDQHSIGIELLSLYLEYKGWTVMFLGSSMPQHDLLKELATFKPDALIVSVSMLAFVIQFKSLMQAVQVEFPNMLTIGGGGKSYQPILKQLCDYVPENYSDCHNLLLKELFHA